MFKKRKSAASARLSEASDIIGQLNAIINQQNYQLSLVRDFFELLTTRDKNGEMAVRIVVEKDDMLAHALAHCCWAVESTLKNDLAPAHDMFGVKLH